MNFMNRFKQKLGLLAGMLLVVLLALSGAGNLPPAHAQEPGGKTPHGLLVTLSTLQPSFSAGEAVRLQVTFTNPGTSPLAVLNWYTPTGEVSEPIFSLWRGGEAVPYRGALVKRAAPGEGDYLSLPAGTSRSWEVDLSASYDLSGSGQYSIQYAAAAQELFWEGGSLAGSLVSNTLELFIEGRAPLSPQRAEVDAVSGSTTFTACSPSQQSDLLSARDGASTYSADAVGYFNANKQGARYITWFGVFNATRYATVKSNFNAIQNAVDNANPMHFDCSSTDPSFYAYVYPGEEYDIYLGGAFWAAPLIGTDSKAGTLIHEISHFYVVASTVDHVYGQSGARDLAISNPADAIENADNHEYFAENNPPLETTTMFIISGNAGIGGATLTYTGGTATADSSGAYSFGVLPGWSGSVTPSRSGYTFTPPSRTYTNVTSNQVAQNYTASGSGSLNLLQDPGFEAYTPNPYWSEYSTNYGTPLCTVADCGDGDGTALPHSGDAWAWFGGTASYEEGSLSQSVLFPTGSAHLQFYFWIGKSSPSASPADLFTADIDGSVVFATNATEIASYPAYTRISLDVSAFADGAVHTITFYSLTDGQMIDFNLDDISLTANATATFEDVPTDYWAWEAIESLYSAGITSGCSSDPLLFCPESPVTRAQMAKFLLRTIFGPSYTPPAASGLFTDVPSDHWARDWIEQLYLVGITSGCGMEPLVYCPEAVVTRAQMAKFLLRAEHGSAYLPPPGTGLFSDVPPGYWAVDWIEQLFAEGITTGCSSLPFSYCPENPVTRAQMAVFLVRTFDLP